MGESERGPGNQDELVVSRSRGEINTIAGGFVRSGPTSSTRKRHLWSVNAVSLIPLCLA